MKSLLVPVLVLGLATCVVLLVLQQHHYQKLSERQDQAIAAVQAKYDALLRTSQATRRVETTRKLSDAARVQAKSLAPRYESLNRITGYAKKTAQN